VKFDLPFPRKNTTRVSCVNKCSFFSRNWDIFALACGPTRVTCSKGLQSTTSLDAPVISLISFSKFIGIFAIFLSAHLDTSLDAQPGFESTRWNAFYTLQESFNIGFKISWGFSMDQGPQFSSMAHTSSKRLSSTISAKFTPTILNFSSTSGHTWFPVIYTHSASTRPLFEI
jgi:hypothetical protein